MKKLKRGLSLISPLISPELAAFDCWNAASIDQRHALLMALAKDIWKTSPIDS